nr:MAG TPA: hypothetical protein [Caudoviricetes sp.]
MPRRRRLPHLLRPLRRLPRHRPHGPCHSV